MRRAPGTPLFGGDSGLIFEKESGAVIPERGQDHKLVPEDRVQLHSPS